MDALLLISRLVLAGVFVVAAVAKLVDLDATRRAFRQLGVPERAVAVAVVLLPLAELAIAVALVPAGTARWAAVAAVGLLAVFTAVVGVAVARGSEAECHCFGSVSSRPVGVGTLGRNAGLLALASFVVVGGHGASATAWVTDLSAPEAALAGVTAALAVGLAFNAAFLFQLFRQNGRLITELEELRSEGSRGPDTLEVGDYLADFELPDSSGEPVELEDLLDGERGLMLLFTSPDCGACDPLLPAVGRSQRDRVADPALVLVSVGEPDRGGAKASEHGIDQLLIIEEGFDLPRSLGVTGFPGAVILDADGRLAAEPVLGATALAPLIGYQSAAPELVRVEGSA